jgi:enamine deaminase RidA (YjgF/YER057c/UK114 family)
MAPVANYVPFVVSGDSVVISGQLPAVDGKVACTGKLGADVSEADARAAARQCGVNLIAQLRLACGGDLDRLAQVVRLGGFIACTPEFTSHAAVMNGASDLMVEVFGDAGRHARSTVGVPSLPLDAAVEVEGLFRIAS